MINFDNIIILKIYNFIFFLINFFFFNFYHFYRIIKGIDEDMTKTETKMNFAMKKLSTLLKTQSESKIKLFLTLVCVAVVMFILLIV